MNATDMYFVVASVVKYIVILVHNFIEKCLVLENAYSLWIFRVENAKCHLQHH